MYSIVLVTVLTSGSSAPQMDYYSGGYGCYGYGAYPYFAPPPACLAPGPALGPGSGAPGFQPSAPWGLYGHYGGCGIHGNQPAYGYNWQRWGPSPSSTPPAPPMPPADGPKKIEDDTPRPETTATVVIQAPREAIITVNGVKLQRTAVRESFRTPRLDPDGPSKYDVVVTMERDGLPVREARRITVEPGRRTELDFRRLERKRPLGGERTKPAKTASRPLDPRLPPGRPR